MTSKNVLWLCANIHWSCVGNWKTVNYTGSAKFIATHILTWFSNKNEENWKFIATANSQITCKSIHLSFITSIIFNNLLQSPLKSIVRGTQNFLWNQGPFPLQFGLQILEIIMRSFGRPCIRGWTIPKSTKDSDPGFLGASLPCWWTPGCGPESTVGSFLSHVRAPSLAGRSNVLPRSALGPIATVQLPKCPRCTAGCSI